MFDPNMRIGGPCRKCGRANIEHANGQCPKDNQVQTWLKANKPRTNNSPHETQSTTPQSRKSLVLQFLPSLIEACNEHWKTHWLSCNINPDQPVAPTLLALHMRTFRTLRLDMGLRTGRSFAIEELATKEDRIVALEAGYFTFDDPPLKQCPVDIIGRAGAFKTLAAVDSLPRYVFVDGASSIEAPLGDLNDILVNAYVPAGTLSGKLPLFILLG